MSYRQSVRLRSHSSSSSSAKLTIKDHGRNGKNTSRLVYVGCMQNITQNMQKSKSPVWNYSYGKTIASNILTNTCIYCDISVGSHLKCGVQLQGINLLTTSSREESNLLWMTF